MATDVVVREGEGDRGERSSYFPFTAIVGMERMKLALLAGAVAPMCGGVLVVGERGTAKSTAARALARLLPDVEVVRDCPFSCDPDEPSCPGGPHGDGAVVTKRPVKVVELPLGCSLERLVGEVDVEAALSQGKLRFRPGLLAEANRGILYVDEVNLLADHLVDVLLDAAAMGVNHVEREGVSVSHPARFLLVGTMNPDEGDLRPQLLDRFGLCVAVRASRDPAERSAIAARRLEFDLDPVAFSERWSEEERRLSGRVHAAVEALPRIRMTDEAVQAAGRICASLGIESMRAEVTMLHAARAIAALHGADAVAPDWLREAALLALPHRLGGSLALSRLEENESRIASAVEEVLGGPDPEGPRGRKEADDSDTPRGAEPHLASEAGGRPRAEAEVFAGGPDPRRSRDEAPEAARKPGARPQGSERASAAGQDLRFGSGLRSGSLPRLGSNARPGSDPGPESRWPDLGMQEEFYVVRLALTGRGGGPPGKRSPGHLREGPVVDFAPHWATPGAGPDLLRTWAKARIRTGHPESAPRASDLVCRVRQGREAHLFVVAVDCSGSMAAKKRVEVASELILSLLEDAYRCRDAVSVVVFGGRGAEVLGAPTRSPRRLAETLRSFPLGGRTPLAAGLSTAARVCARERARHPGLRSMAIVVSDGRANEPWPEPEVAATEAAGELAREADAVLYADTDAGFPRIGMMEQLARSTGAVWVRAAELADSTVPSILLCASAFRRRAA